MIHLYHQLWPAALADVRIDLDKLSGAASRLVELAPPLRQPLLSFMSEAHTHIEWWKRDQSKGSSSKFVSPSLPRFRLLVSANLSNNRAGRARCCAS